jgi:hypothetical protein
MNVFQELLDLQLVDRDDCELGRADGILVELRDGEQPRILGFEVGFVSLARRISRRLERLAESLHERLGVRREARYFIGWEKMLDRDTNCVKLDVNAAQTPAYDWELWLRRHVVNKIPGASTEE